MLMKRLTIVVDLKLFVTSVLHEEPWKYDSKVIPMPWRQAEEDIIETKISSGGLTLGFYNCDGNVSIWADMKETLLTINRYFHILLSFVGWRWSCLH